MTASHGREGCRGRSWLITALAASGLCLAARPAPACHIHHETPEHSDSGTASAASTESPTQILDSIMQNWPARPQAEPQVIAPAPATAPATITPTAAPSPSPSVGTFQQTTSMPCMPPVPPSVVRTAPAAEAQGIAPLLPPAALLVPPLATPAPEPSTILSALALAGAFAWRRRAGRARA